MSAVIERLKGTPTSPDVTALAELLLGAVRAGAAVSFLDSLTQESAEQWWRDGLGRLHPRAVVLVARDGGRIVGTVQLQPAWAPNQPHRADIAKLLVAPTHQRSGLGARLMSEIEVDAAGSGFSLLTLDAKAGGAAERLYRRLGWTMVGTVPDFALDPNGAMHDAVIMYKRL